MYIIQGCIYIYWITTYSLPQTVCLHPDGAWLTKFFPHGSQYERHQVPSCWEVLKNIKENIKESTITAYSLGSFINM